MNELNITPLLDLVFVLLVIFIITTPQLVNNLEINLPSGKKPPVDLKPKPPTQIAVSAAGQITLNDEVVTVPELKDRLTRLKTEDPKLGVVVKGSDEVDYQVMVNVMDTLRQLDITKMGLVTE
jgi:biopolymer transport protein ExbD